MAGEVMAGEAMAGEDMVGEAVADVTAETGEETEKMRTESRGSQSRRGAQQGERDVSSLDLTTQSDEPIDYSEWPSSGDISNFLFQITYLQV